MSFLVSCRRVIYEIFLKVRIVNQVRRENSVDALDEEDCKMFEYLG